MGYINFISRKDPTQIFTSNTLTAYPLDIDNLLEGILPGDTIQLTLALDAETYHHLKDQEIPGMMVSTNLFQDKNGNDGFEAELRFLVKERIHQVCRDWMEHPPSGFRHSSTFISVVAFSDEAENLFMEIEEKYQRNIKEKTLAA